MRLTEILAEIPKLSFAEQQELVCRAIEAEGQDLTGAEKAILGQRLADFHQNPDSGIPQNSLKPQCCSGLRRNDLLVLIAPSWTP